MSVAVPADDDLAVWRGEGWHLLAMVHRQQGRDAARLALRRQLARGEVAGIRLPELSAPKWASGGNQVSTSHGLTLSVLAWCEHGRIGVDVVELDLLDSMGQQELSDTAALYLGASQQITSADDLPQARRRFAAAWARHEAGLKYAGQALDEHPSEPQRDATMLAMSRDGDAAARWIVAIVRDLGPSQALHRLIDGAGLRADLLKA